MKLRSPLLLSLVACACNELLDNKRGTPARGDDESQAAENATEAASPSRPDRAAPEPPSSAATASAAPAPAPSTTSLPDGCAQPCPVLPGAAALCTGGVCGFACVADREDCDGLAANGCETSLSD